MSDRASVIAELYRRMPTLEPRQQAIVQELAKREVGTPGIGAQPNGALDMLHSGTQFGPLASQTPPSIPAVRDAQNQSIEHRQFREDYPIGSWVQDTFGAGIPGPIPMSTPGSVASPGLAKAAANALPEIGPISRAGLHLVPGGRTLLRVYDAVGSLLPKTPTGPEVGPWQGPLEKPGFKTGAWEGPEPKPKITPVYGDWEGPEPKPPAPPPKPGPSPSRNPGTLPDVPLSGPTWTRASDLGGGLPDLNTSSVPQGGSAAMPSDSPVAGGPAPLAPIDKFEMNRLAHARAQEIELPGSPAGKSGHGFLSDAARKKFNVKSWSDLSVPQMREIYDSLPGGK